jgi:hypothetical protein
MPYRLAAGDQGAADVRQQPWLLTELPWRDLLDEWPVFCCEVVYIATARPMNRAGNPAFNVFAVYG